MIYFEVTIYEDALSLLLGEKTDIRDEILGQIQQGDPCLENVANNLRELCEELVVDTEKIMEKFEDASCEKLMEYIAFSEGGITFNYEESIECGDRRMCAFNIMCSFDADKFIEDTESEGKE